MNDNQIIFAEPGHPTIKVFEDMVSIKAIDYWDFRDFKLNKIKSLEFYRPFDRSIIGLLFYLQPYSRKYREKDDYILRIKLKDGEYWDYKTTYKYSKGFTDLIADIQSRLLV